MRLVFKIIGKPMGKQRPKFSRTNWGVRTYTPKETANYEQLVRLAWYDYHNDFKFADDDILQATIEVYMDIPKSASKKKKEMMKGGLIRPTKKPDWDNLGKIICDSLNGIAYKDDAAFVDVTVSKWYVKRDNMSPQVIVTLCNDGTLIKQ